MQSVPEVDEASAKVVVQKASPKPRKSETLSTKSTATPAAPAAPAAPRTTVDSDSKEAESPEKETDHKTRKPTDYRSRESIQTKVPSRDDATRSILEKERVRREKRVRERMQREKAKAREQEERKNDERALASSRRDIIHRAAQVREAATKERKRIEVFREKQKAAQVQTALELAAQVPEQRYVSTANAHLPPSRARQIIQLNWKGRDDNPAESASPKRTAQNLGPNTPSRASSEPPANGIRFHKLTGQFEPTPEWKRTIAVLTIQLYWRQYVRRKALQRVARRKKVLHSWDPSAVVKTQSRRVSSVYGQPLVFHPYKAAPTVSMRRPRPSDPALVNGKCP